MCGRLCRMHLPLGSGPARSPASRSKGPVRSRWDDLGMNDSLGTWEPLTPDGVAGELRGLSCRWWIAGGWAIDLHLGRQSRAHADVDVLFLRADQSQVQGHLAGWDLHAADPPGTLRPWSEGEHLAEGISDIWCRRSPSSPWSLQLMIDDAEDGAWVYRRDSRIRRPVAELDGPASNSDHRVLTPDVQLLYKSLNPRAKDEADFQSVRQYLDSSQRRWLRESLAVIAPVHPWLAVL